MNFPEGGRCAKVGGVWNNLETRVFYKCHKVCWLEHFHSQMLLCIKYPSFGLNKKNRNILILSGDGN